MTFQIGGIQIRCLQSPSTLELFEMSAEKEELGPGLHVHQKMEESFYILSGKVLFTVGGRKTILQAGESLTVVRNTIHGWQTAEKSTKMLIFFTPAQGQLRYYAELEKLQNQGNSWGEAISVLAKSTDNTPVTSPL